MDERLRQILVTARAGALHEAYADLCALTAAELSEDWMWRHAVLHEALAEGFTSPSN